MSMIACHVVQNDFVVKTTEMKNPQPVNIDSTFHGTCTHFELCFFAQVTSFRFKQTIYLSLKSSQKWPQILGYQNKLERK